MGYLLFSFGGSGKKCFAPSSRLRARMRSIPSWSAFGIEVRDSKGLGFYPAGAFGNEPYLAQAMMGIDVDNNVYSAQVPTTSVYENNIWFEKVNTEEWQKMMSRVKQGLSPTEETVVDSATGTVMSSAGTGGSGSGDSGSKNSSSSSSLSSVKIAVKNGSGIQGCANEAASKLTPQGAVCETGNADDYNYKKTIVVYSGTDSSQAQKIADLLGVGTVKKNDGTYSFTGDHLVVVGQDWK